MEAKDIILKPSELMRRLGIVQEDPLITSVRHEGAAIQSVVSFDAGKQEGIREVVEWLEKHKDDREGYDWGLRNGSPVILFSCDPLEWQAKLKELEVEL